MLLKELFCKIKKRFVLVLGLTILVVLVFPLSTFAQTGLSASLGKVLGVFTFPAAIIVFAFVSIFFLISQSFVFLAGALLDWIISPSFVSLSYTIPCPAPYTGNNPPNCNPIIGIGLDVTKSFVNLALVLILVYIAISIALRLGETDAKKMFVRLILVALLVNFAPLIVRAIVDAANAVGNYFLKGIGVGFSSFITQIGNWGSDILNILASITDIRGQFSILTKTFVLIILNLGTGCALLLFAALFLVRYVAIWVLVILSPLAFVSWIVPKLKSKFWNQWLNQVIHWSFVGIPMAFFLYLAAKCYAILPNVIKSKMTSDALDPFITSFINQIFSYFVILIFLYGAFTVGLKTSAMGANSVINFTKEYGKKGAYFAGGKIKSAASQILGERKEWMEQQAAASLREVPPGLNKLGVVGKILGWATLITPAYWAMRKGIGEAGLRLTETDIKDIKKNEDEYKDTLPERKISGIKDALRIGDYIKASGILRQAIDERQIDDLKKLGLTPDEIRKIGKGALRIHPDIFKKIRDTFPHLAEHMAEGFSDRLKEEVGLNPLTQSERSQGMTIPMRIMMKIKPEFIKNMDEDALMNTEVQKFFHYFANTSQVASLLTEGPARARNAYIETVKRQGLDFYKRVKPDLANYFQSNPGIRALGGPLEEEENTEEPLIKVVSEREDISKYKKGGS